MVNGSSVLNTEFEGGRHEIRVFKNRRYPIIPVMKEQSSEFRSKSNKIAFDQSHRQKINYNISKYDGLCLEARNVSVILSLPGRRPQI